ncbi:MAG TPA: FAD-dependent oxidoreductase [Bacillota bacterium]|nr:FAD-dependent oxidoreductase [Bacillota bacterium]HPT88197.1 FAD-dependent oxidoreductase [Bacillota bacterium]
MRKKIIIVGAGVAAVHAIKTIREHNPSIDITVYGEEPFYPYYRLKLSKNLMGNLAEDGLLIQTKAWYETHRVNFYPGRKVVRIAPDQQTLWLADGSCDMYDSLLLANGAANNPPPLETGLAGDLYTLRTLADARRIQKRVLEKSRIVNIGGGVQGIETAWALCQHQKKVLVVEIGPRLFPNQLDEAAAAIVKKSMEAFGVQVLTDTRITKACGEQACEGVVTADGQRIDCDMVIYATGIRPNLDILEGTSIKRDRGVLVDDTMQTNIPNIYAAGDVAEYMGRVGGLWSIAMAQGKVAGSNMVHYPLFYRPVVPVTVLNAFQLGVFSMGTIVESNDTFSVIEEDIQANRYSRIFIRENRIVGAIVIGDLNRSNLLKRAIEKEVEVNGRDWTTVSVDGLLSHLRRQLERQS